MRIHYTNKLQRIALLISGRVIGTLAYVASAFLILATAINSNPEGFLLIISVLGITFIFMILHQWFSFYRYIFNYSRINRRSMIILDIEAGTIECKKTLQSSRDVQNISNITLVRHENFKREIDSPKSVRDKVVNILADGPEPLGFRNIWYVKVLTENGQRYYLTPLMLKIKELPFKDLNLDFIKRPIIDYGS